jgi:hypothetical protein
MTNTLKQHWLSQNKHYSEGIHEYNDPIEALQNAEGIFTGGILFTCYTALQKQFT